MRRRDVLAMIGGAVAAPVLTPLPLGAQRLPTVGWLYPGPVKAAPPRITAFLDGLRDAGFLSPDEVEFLARIADGDSARLEPLARDLVDRNVDVIIAVSLAAIDAAVQVTHSAKATVPIVAMSFETDPVASGLVASLARPGGNVTGLFLDHPEFSKKWLELLKEAVPEIAKIAVFWDPATGTMQLAGVEAAARILKVDLDTVAVGSREEIDEAFATARRSSAGAVLMLSSPVFGGDLKLLADLALKHRLRAVTLFTEFPRVGGLMAYGPNLFDAYRHAGRIAARVLQGRKPSQLPVELYSRFELVVNLRTAKGLGVTIPPSILVRAHEVIE